MKNITAKQQPLSNWRDEIEVSEAKVDDVKYGKGKGWDQPEGKSMTSYKSRHSYLKKNPPNVRSDRNERHSAVDVVFHGHDKVEKDRKKKHFKSRNVKTTNTPESDKKKKNKKNLGESSLVENKKINPTNWFKGDKDSIVKDSIEVDKGNTEVLDKYHQFEIDPKKSQDLLNRNPGGKQKKQDLLDRDPKKPTPTPAAKTVNAEEFIPLNVYSTAVNYFYEQGINEDGLDLIIEEIGVETFTDFILDLPEQLNEERSAKKAPKRDYEKVKASVYKKDAARKEKGTGEYSKTKAAKDKYGDEEAPEGAPEKKVATKKKVKKSVAKAKTKQSSEPASKKGLGDRIKSAYKEGVKRHRKATQGARVFGKGFASGAKKAVKFAKDVHSAVSEEIQGGVSVETYTKDTKFMEIETLDVITAEPLRSDWRGDLKEVAIDKRITTTKGEFGKPGFSMNVRQMSDKEISNKLPTIGGVKLEMDQDGNVPNLGQFVSDTAVTQANKFADSGIIDNNQTVGAAMGAKAGLDKPMTGDQFKQLAQDGTKDLAFNINKEIKGTTANRLQGVADNINKSTSNLKGKLSTSSGAITNSYSWRDELYLGERLGGKGYSRKAAASSVYPGKKGTGDWENSDRGKGNRAKRRAGEEVEVKSPTYLAHVKNKDKK